MSSLYNSSPNGSQGPQRPSSPSGFDSGSPPPPKRDQRPRPHPGQQRSPMTPLPRSISSSRQVSRSTAAYSPVDRTAPTMANEISSEPRFNRWLVGAFLMVIVLGGVAGASAVSLLRIPNLPNCRAIFWPLASAATRLQCAEAYADQGSVESLLAAISLVEALPADHPLRSEINDRVELWADEILHIADQTFNEGELETAISIAEQIPQNTAAAALVSDRIAQWQTIWEQAESIFRKAENHLRASNFREAFSAAIQLRSVDNEYWSSTRYDELTSLISLTREEVNILANAERTARSGNLDDIVAAIEQVAAIAPDSYVYDQAQTVLATLSGDLLDLAEAALADQNSAEALRILGEIPDSVGLEKEIADFRTLAEAYELTWIGTTAGYEAAIVRLQSIGSDRPLYARARELRQQWQAELEGVAQLNWAQQVARSGTVDSLRAAITEAEEVAPSNPIWDEVQAQIEAWRRDIALIEDQPYIDRAKLTATSGDRTGLQAAITEVQQISSNSALYDEAQDLAADWRWQIQRMDNQPILNQARTLAESGRLEQAIEVASQIPANQAIYDEAQTAIANWQSQQQSRESYQQALLVAESGTAGGLTRAINLAQSVPQSSPDWTLAQQAADQWSWDVLAIAESTAFSNPVAAAEIAQQIPQGTAAYSAAQQRLQEWRAPLNGADAIEAINQ
ncbi:MAG: chromosome segregation ATPase [Cyanobacteria bacterium P01_C01_bin.120]